LLRAAFIADGGGGRHLRRRAGESARAGPARVGVRERRGRWRPGLEWDDPERGSRADARERGLGLDPKRHATEEALREALAAQGYQPAKREGAPAISYERRIGDRVGPDDWSRLPVGAVVDSGDRSCSPFLVRGPRGWGWASARANGLGATLDGDVPSASCARARYLRSPRRARLRGGRPRALARAPRAQRDAGRRRRASRRSSGAGARSCPDADRAPARRPALEVGGPARRRGGGRQGGRRRCARRRPPRVGEGRTVAHKARAHAHTRAR